MSTNTSLSSPFLVFPTNPPLLFTLKFTSSLSLPSSSVPLSLLPSFWPHILVILSLLHLSLFHSVFLSQSVSSFSPFRISPFIRSLLLILLTLYLLQQSSKKPTLLPVIGINKDIYEIYDGFTHPHHSHYIPIITLSIIPMLNIELVLPLPVFSNMTVINKNLEHAVRFRSAVVNAS